jgi:hypothetical protein
VGNFDKGGRVRSLTDVKIEDRESFEQTKSALIQLHRFSLVAFEIETIRRLFRYQEALVRRW